MATPSELPYYLRGSYAPVEAERTAHDLAVDGAIPPALRGLYLRNGPNPKPGSDPGHWFLGDGMVHGVRLEEGRAAWYRNRWARTKPFTGEDDVLVKPDGTIDRSVALANTHVIRHAGRILALVETSFPTELTPELDTLGLHDFGGKLTTGMTAHPKVCPDTGEMHFFGYGFLPPYLTYHVADASGRLVRSEVIDVPGPTMMHDFAITREYVIFMDLPIVFDVERALSGEGLVFTWSDAYGARLGVMPRGGSPAQLRWLEIQPCYVFHPMNAYEEDGRITLDVVRYPELWRGGPEGFDPAYLHRFRIDLAGGKVDEESLDDLSIEFPRVDERRTGSANRYGYAVTTSVAGAIETSRLVKYDVQSGTREEHDFGAGRQPGEAVFVPAADGAGEDEGYLLCFVYDAARDGSDFVVLDAGSLAAPPLARVELPQRVPYGFHGSWLPDPD